MMRTFDTAREVNESDSLMTQYSRIVVLPEHTIH